jgi:ribosomal protein S2
MEIQLKDNQDKILREMLEAGVSFGHKKNQNPSSDEALYFFHSQRH